MGRRERRALRHPRAAPWWPGACPSGPPRPPACGWSAPTPTRPTCGVKPRPDTGALGWRQLGVEVYGGALVNSWLDRDLGLSGRVSLADGSTRLVQVDRPLLRVAQLAIHLDRDVNEKGVVLDRQQHLAPIWGLGAPVEGELRAFLAAEAGVDPDRRRGVGRDAPRPHAAGAASASTRSCSVSAPPRQPVLVAGARSLRSRRPVTATATAMASRSSPMVALFDHEEIGSESHHGRGGSVPRHDDRAPRRGPWRQPRRSPPRARRVGRACPPTWPTPSTRTTPSATSPSTARSPTAARSSR